MAKKKTKAMAEAEAAVLTIDKLQENEVLAIVNHFREFVDQNHQGARQVLMANEELTRFLAAALLRLGMLKDTQLEDNAQAEFDPEQQELLQQVRTITPDIVRTLPREQQIQIMELRQAMGLPPLAL